MNPLLPWSRGPVVGVLLLISIVTGPGTPAVAAESPATSEISKELSQMSQTAVQQAKNARLAAADIVTFLAPKWISRPGWSSELYVLNNFSDSIDIEVEVADPNGRVLATTVLPVDSAQHEVLAIGSLLGSSGEGSLRIRFSGDKDMIQAWMVLSSPEGVTEMVLKNLTDDAERRLTTFWDLRGLKAGRTETEYFLVNGGDGPLHFTIRSGGPQPGRLLTTELLLPGEQATWSPQHGSMSAPFGWVEIDHNGAPGALAVGGLIHGDQLLATLPITTPDQRSSSPEHHAVRLPFASELAAGSGDARLTIVNSAQEAQEVSVTVVAAHTGELMEEESLFLQAESVTTIDLGRSLQSLPELGSSSARIVVRGQVPGLLVDGRSRNFLTGETVEIAFFPREKAHGNGSYPLPDPERFDVRTTLVNLGEEDSQVVSQIFWSGGTFAMDPITVPAGATRSIDFGTIAGSGDEDRLGPKQARSAFWM